MGPQTQVTTRMEWMWEERSRNRVLLVSGVIILVLATVDWWTKPYVSIGFLYLFPIMLAAGFLPRWILAVLGLGCAVLSALYSSPSTCRSPVWDSKPWRWRGADCSSASFCAIAA